MTEINYAVFRNGELGSRQDISDWTNDGSEYHIVRMTANGEPFGAKFIAHHIRRPETLFVSADGRVIVTRVGTCRGVKTLESTG